MIIKHFVKLSRSFHSEIIFIMTLSLLKFNENCSSLSQFKTRHAAHLQGSIICSRSSLVVLLYHPVSISNLCAEIRIFVSASLKL